MPSVERSESSSGILRLVPVIIPTGFAQVTFNFEGALIPDGKGATVFGISLEGGTLGTLVAGWASTFVANFGGSLHDSLTFTTAIGVTAFDSTESIVNETGEASGDPCPPNVCLHVRKYTGFRGRRAIGHMYPPGLIYDDQVGDDGIINPTNVAGRQSQFNAWMAAAPSDMVLLNRSEGSSPPPANPRTVTALIVDQLVSTQRGRLR